MRYMLDTCAFIDAVTEPDNLGADVCALMEDYENEFCISIETIREVILKYKSKKVWTKVWQNADAIVESIYNKIGFVSPERRYEAPGCCTAAAKVIIIMGKDAGFSWFPNRSVAINSRENRVKPLSNIYKQRLTVSKHATNETKYSVLRRVRAQRDCPRRHAFANYLI